MDQDDRIDPDKYRDQKTAILFLSRCFPDPTQAGLAVAKIFYFFFYGAFGSLFPLMGVYFKQMGMDAAQAGLLSGIRPIVEYLAIPFWNKIASKLQKGEQHFYVKARDILVRWVRQLVEASTSY